MQRHYCIKIVNAVININLNDIPYNMLGYSNASASAALRVINYQATFSSNTDSATSTAYPYKCDIPIEGCTADKQATVTFGDTEAKSGDYAPFCETLEDTVRVFSKVNTAITIPAVVVENVSNFYDVDGTPTSGSTRPITSGGVYSALGDYVTKGTTQTITGRKTWYSDNYSQGPVIKSGRTTVNQNIGGFSFLDGNDKESCQTWVSKNRAFQVLMRNESDQTVTMKYKIDQNGTGCLETQNINLLNPGLVQSANSAAGSMTLNFMGRNSANTADISRSYIQFYHAPGTSSATSTNLLYLRAYKDDCTNYVDLSMDATNGAVSSNGRITGSNGVTSNMCLLVNPGADTNYREGIRIAKATDNWGLIMLGTTAGSTSGMSGWIIGNDPNGTFMVSGKNATASTGLLYGSYDSSTGYHTLYVPHNFRVGGQQVMQFYNSAYNVASIATWGTLTSANGYTHVAGVHSAGGEFKIASSAANNGIVSAQLDGWFYQNEGRYRCLDTSDRDDYTGQGSLSHLTTWVASSNVVTRNTIAYWDGRYDSSSTTSSNLLYCRLGAFKNGAVRTFASSYESNTSGNFTFSIGDAATFGGWNSPSPSVVVAPEYKSSDYPADGWAMSVYYQNGYWYVNIRHGSGIIAGWHWIATKA